MATTLGQMDLFIVQSEQGGSVCVCVCGGGRGWESAWERSRRLEGVA